MHVKLDKNNSNGKNHVFEQPASSSVALIYKSLGVRFLSPDIQHRSEIELSWNNKNYVN